MLSEQLAVFEQPIVPVEDIYVPEEKLRGADVTSEKFLNFKAAIAAKGQLSPVEVAMIKGRLTLVNGVQRLTALKELGIPTIKVTYLDIESEADFFEKQIVANFNVETKPAEFARQVVRILDLDPELTKAQLCKRLGVEIQWMNNRLKLNSLNLQVAGEVDNGNINLAKATAMATLPEDTQLELLEDALTTETQAFVAKCNEMLRELRKETRKATEEQGFVPKPNLREKTTLITEMSTGAAGNAYCKTPEQLELWKTAIAYTLQLDPASVDVAKKDYEEKKAKREKQNKEAQEARLERKRFNVERQKSRLDLQGQLHAKGEDPNKHVMLDEFDAETKKLVEEKFGKEEAATNGKA